MAAEEAPAPLDGIPRAEAAHILDVSPNTVYRLLRSGRLPAGRRHRSRQLSRTAVEQLALARYKWRQPRQRPGLVLGGRHPRGRDLGVNRARGWVSSPTPACCRM